MKVDEFTAILLIVCVLNVHTTEVCLPAHGCNSCRVASSSSSNVCINQQMAGEFTSEDDAW